MTEHEKKLNALWEEHMACEFEKHDADATMKTMTDDPYVNHVPTMTGGVGSLQVRHFYRDHFVSKLPKNTKIIPLSRTIGVDRLVDEQVFCFTHDSQIDFMLPGIAPTGKYVEVSLVVIVYFKNDKVWQEHIYWDQASVLVQIGLLNPKGLPVCGIEQAQKMLDKNIPSNHLIP